MNIKMKVKKNKNSKTKIGLKNLLVSKNQTPFKPKCINIQTINIQKNFNYFNDEKNFFNSKNINNIRYIHNSSLNNYNISTKNDYFLNKNRNSFFNSFDSDRAPSSINSVESSPYIPSGKKKFKRKKILHKKNKYKYMNKNNSFHNLSFNTNSNTNTNINTNISYINSSSSSSLEDNENDYSSSSSASYKSKSNRRKKYLDKMMVEENELDYLKRSEVGLISSDEEENTNSVDNNNSIEENFNNEIERILIEIYNKNISLISSGNCSEINKTSGEIEDIEKQIKKYLKRENFKTNLLVLRSLANKIKELVGKYKEKVFEIEELKNLHTALQRQIINEQIYRNNNSLESNVATNSNSNGSYNNSFLEEGLILNPNEEMTEKGITNILLRELINIKRTLKISSKEIEGIFKYPLNILKDEKGKKIKFSVELMQREEFCKTLLNDEIISTLLTQIKDIFYRSKNSEIKKWILELDENYEHKNEMTRFIAYINDKLSLNKKNNNNENNNNNDNNNFLEEQKNNKENYDLNEDNIIQKDKIYEKEMEDISKKIKKKRNKKIENNDNNKNQEEKIDELKFKDIDEILNYINDETDSKKGKKKGKKQKKNKNKKLLTKEELKENEDKNNINNNEYLSNFEKEFQSFKEELIKDTVFVYEINNKIKPNLSQKFLNQISIA